MLAANRRKKQPLARSALEKKLIWKNPGMKVME
jgi:hypothetical protein